MLKQFWPTTPSSSLSSLPPTDQLTPRAVSSTNPFESTTNPSHTGQGVNGGNVGGVIGNGRQSPALTHSPKLGGSSSSSSGSGSGGGFGGGGATNFSGSSSSTTFVGHSSGGTRTPTTGEFPHSALPLPLGTPGASRPTTGITVGDSLGGQSNIGFGLREPPKMRRAMTKEKGEETTATVTTPVTATTNVKSGLSTSLNSSGEELIGGGGGPPSSTGSISVASSTSGANTPSALSGGNTTSSQGTSGYVPERAPRGTLTIKLIAARGLALSPNTTANGGQGKPLQPEPYVVIQFEQNEFVSRPPIPTSPQVAKTPFTTSTPLPAGVTATSKPSPLPRTNSYGPSLGIGSISRAFADAARRTKSGKKEKEKESISGASTPRLDEDKEKKGLGSGNPSEPVWKEEVAFDLTSSNSLIYVTVYDRSQDGEGFLGMKEIKPVLKDGVTIDNWFALSPRGEERVSGEIWLQISYDARKSKQHLTPKDFDIMKLIGRGTFGRVYQVRKRDTKRIYAMKMLSKKDIVAKKEIAHTIGERKILQRSLECPFLVGLKFSFQTEDFLFFITDYKSGGELFWHLQKEGRFTEQRAKFYIAELVLALEHLHKFDIVYRDLKPENILLDATGHIALCDFGLSKPDLGSDELTNTFCGTTEYLAPEVLLDDHGYSKLVDFWSLGVLLFEMCCGWSPFYSEDVQQMYKNICFGKIRFPRGVIDEDGKQFVKGLLNRNPKHRLGAERDAAELKEHPFFKNIDWRLLAMKQVTPPFKPVVESDESVANFDPLFTSSDLRDVPFDWSRDEPPGAQSLGHSYNGPGGGIPTDRNGVPVKSGEGAMNIKPTRPPLGTPLTSSVQENFRGFTYTGESMMPGSVGALRIDDDEDEEYDDEAVYEDYDEMDVGEEGASRTRRQSDVEMDG